MPDITVSVPQRPKRTRHPCVTSFTVWAFFLASAIVAALAAGSPLFLLLGLPAVGPVYLLGARIVRGHPRVDSEAIDRFDRILIDVGGIDAFGVTVQDQVVDPVRMFRGHRPRVVADAGFVKSSGDELLRGVAALEHGALRCRGFEQRRKNFQLTMDGIVVLVLILIVVTTPRNALPFAAVAAVGAALWLHGVIAAAWTHAPNALANYYREVDAAAVGLIGDPHLIGDSLTAMEQWRKANRRERSVPDRIAQRLLQPVRPSHHVDQRVARLGRGDD